MARYVKQTWTDGSGGGTPVSAARLGVIETGIFDASSAQVLADSTAGGAVASFDFTSIAATFAHLLVIVTARGDTAATTTGARLRLNNDSTTTYGSQQASALAAANSAGEEATGTPSSALLGNFTAASAPASGASPVAFFIPNYAATAFFKNGLVLAGDRRGGGASGIGLLMGTFQWASTAAINRITIFPAAGNLVTGSRATILGLG